ncbi:MAG: hypothetical protein ACRC9F_00900 [Metamycoplasmataceae bacterium]
MSIYKELKKKDFAVTELSEYLGITRPTLYKYFDLYDNKKWKSIPKEILTFFKLLSKNPLIGKRYLIKYLIDDYKKDDYEKNQTLIAFIKKQNSNLKDTEIDLIVKCINNEKLIAKFLKIIDEEKVNE